MWKKIISAMFLQAKLRIFFYKFWFYFLLKCAQKHKRPTGVGIPCVKVCGSLQVTWWSNLLRWVQTGLLPEHCIRVCSQAAQKILTVEHRLYGWLMTSFPANILPKAKIFLYRCSGQLMYHLPSGLTNHWVYSAYATRSCSDRVGVTLVCNSKKPNRPHDLGRQ